MWKPRRHSISSCNNIGASHWYLVGVLGIAIFALPTALIGSGLMEAMDENKREKELGEYYDRVLKVFFRNANKALRIPGKHLRHAQAPCTLGLTVIPSLMRRRTLQRPSFLGGGGKGDCRLDRQEL